MRKVLIFIRDAVLGIIALGLFGALLSLFLVTVREEGYRNREYKAGVYKSPAVSLPLEESAGEGVGRIEVYVEGEGEPPEWYRPDEPMAAEWHSEPAACETDEVDYILDVPLTLEFQIYLHGLCEDAGVPYTLAVAVIEQESHYDATAISPWNDWGLMQISHVCHAWLSEELGITDFLDPWQNVRAGVYILGGYYAKYKYESGTLVAYNRGQAYAEDLFARGIYCTGYSDSVMSIRQRLEREGR